jgi:Protein of unknown function (DUF4232)
MRRHGQDFLRPRRTWAGVVALAVVAGIAFGMRVTGGRPAAGTIRPGGTAASQPIVPACAHLRVSWSSRAVSTMPGTIYALVFRNTAAGPCVLEGWPRVTVRAPASLTGLRVIDGSASGGFGPIRATRVVLGPGAEAAADVQIGTPADGLGCAAPTWSVTPPGDGRGTILSQAPAPLGQPEPAGPVSVCANGSVEVSPVYPGDQPMISPYPPQPAPSTSPLYSEAAGPEPPACAAAALRARVTDTVTGQQGSFIIVRLSARGRECTLRGTSAPTIRLHEAGGAEPMGKIFPTPGSQRATASVLAAYGDTITAPTALPLGGAAPVTAVLLLPRSGSCGDLTSLTIYPGPIGLGPGRTIGIGGAVQVCGRPLVLGFLPVSPAGEAAALARQALAAAVEKGL